MCMYTFDSMSRNILCSMFSQHAASLHTHRCIYTGWVKKMRTSCSIGAGADLEGGLGWPWPPQLEGWPPLWPPHFISLNISSYQDDILCVPPRSFDWPPQMPPHYS